ncbi:DUF6691 family protein [Cytophaga hutchinsonii]|uniref:Transporter component n=1 Tax=Cytophaga hutchinsonii (strain ATCC 33406 / DSM 1761 / CIP 103989 / NBRC 15051 / NCIMB 9469 / D465) TaxID=269798 RepID=A0A6N4SPU9_CYTH3|nr:DUF6691 family protein [Cytophaga hutchinsonii]ABG58306.1 transporter component [Cytophaga hutchinsonii ATCC 33406]SFX52915.1 hypothetical protein SAMN04487930_105123 [Cytophaga hutchinsonii ATCC 33406]
MKYIKFFLIGIYFGIVLTKAEVISWFRIQEMFHFQSIHMYGIIGSAVVVGAISVFLIKKFNLKSFGGEEIRLISKEYHKGLLPGGIIFGLGWALTGACPGPMFALLGNGIEVMLVAILSAIAGTFVYGVVKDKLPQ